MDNFLSSSFGVFLVKLFSKYFTARSFESFIILAYGWSVSRCRHTVANYLWLSGAVSSKHFSQFYAFLSGSFYKVYQQLWRPVIHLAASLIPVSDPVHIKIDDTTRKKSGRKIEPADRYRNGAGSARQEYRVLKGINFVYAIIRIPLGLFAGKYISVPVWPRVYLKEKLAAKLGVRYRSRGELAREIVDLLACELPRRHLLVNGDGHYATKAFLRNRPDSVDIISRFPINSKLYDLPSVLPNKRRGRRPKKGALIGNAKTLKDNLSNWIAHPTEKDTFIKSFQGIWHSVLPGVKIRVVLIKRLDIQSQRPFSKKKSLEAFFTTDLSLSPEEILQEYKQRWSIEIDIRDAYAFYGLGQDHCRKYQRIVAVNNFRMLMAAAKTIWFIQKIEKADTFNLTRFRPWYRQKSSLSQLDIMWAWQEVAEHQGISPTIRFLPDMNEIDKDPDHKLPKAA